MELNQQDLPFFVTYVLLDEAKRTRSGKRQTKPMNGLWMSRTRPYRMRLSDVPLRKKVCIEALRRVGRMSLSKAAAYVAHELGESTSADVNRIRLAYYDRRPRAISWDLFFGQFLSFREWVFESSEGQLQLSLDLFERNHGRSRLEDLAKLYGDLRRDPIQRERNLAWFSERGLAAKARIESKRWNPDSDWQMLATDWRTAGRMHAELGDVGEARFHFEHARDIWKTHGHRLPHLQERAFAQLDQEMERLVLVKSSLGIRETGIES